MSEYSQEFIPVLLHACLQPRDYSGEFQNLVVAKVDFVASDLSFWQDNGSSSVMLPVHVSCHTTTLGRTVGLLPATKTDMILPCCQHPCFCHAAFTTAILPALCHSACTTTSLPPTQPGVRQCCQLVMLPSPLITSQPLTQASLSYAPNVASCPHHSSVMLPSPRMSASTLDR